MRGTSIAITTLLAAIISIRHAAASDVCPAPETPRYAFYPAKGAIIRSRVFLLPGTSGTAESFLSQDLVRQWVERMAADGHDVAVLDTVPPKPCYFADGGAEYREQFLAHLHHVFDEVTRDHGPAKSNIIAGGSYGGVHVLVGYSATRLFDSWIASFPLVRLSALEELKSVGEVPLFDPFHELDRLRHSTGIMTWGTGDMRVNYHIAKELYAELDHSSVKAIEYPGIGHVTQPQEINDLVTWVAKR